MRSTLVRDNSLTPKQVRWSARSYTYKYKYIHVYTNTIYIYIYYYSHAHMYDDIHHCIQVQTSHIVSMTSLMTCITYTYKIRIRELWNYNVFCVCTTKVKLGCFEHERTITSFFLVNKNALILKNYIAMSNSKSKATLNTIFNVVVVSNQIDKSTSTLHSISKALMLEEWEVGLYRVIPCHT